MGDREISICPGFIAIPMELQELISCRLSFRGIPEAIIIVVNLI